MRKSDRDILDVFVKNRKEGVRMLFDRYYRPLVLYAGSLIDDDTMAEDLVQEFFVRLWEDDYLKHIEEKALSSYLFSSVRNSCYTYTHKKDVLRRRVDYTAIDVAADTATVLNQEIVDRVTAVIARMPEQTTPARLRRSSPSPQTISPRCARAVITSPQVYFGIYTYMVFLNL